MNKINWEVFFGNSSTEEALAYFAQGRYSFDKFAEECWPKECKLEIKLMKSKGYKKCRLNASKALIRRGMSAQNWEWDYHGINGSIGE